MQSFIPSNGRNKPFFHHRLLWMGMVIMLAFVLRVSLLDEQSLRGDEAASATYATFPATKIVAISHTVDPHPPTFYLLLHLWERLTGVSEFAVRLLVVFPAVLSVAMIFALVSRIAGRRAGAVAAFLLAINSYHIWHSQDLRSYTWLLLLGLLASLALWHALNHPRPRNWVWYVISLLGMLYLHYYAVFIIGFHLLFVAYFLCVPRVDKEIEPQRHRDTESSPNKLRLSASLRLCGKKNIILGIVGALVAVTILFLPWLIFSWKFINGFTGDFSPAPLPEVFWRGLNAFAGGLVTIPSQVSGLILAAAGLALAGVIGYWRTNQSAVVFFIFYWLTTIIGIGALSVRGQAFTERYLFAALPGFIALAAMGVVWLWRLQSWGKWLAVGAVAIVLGQNGAALNRYWFDPALAKAPQWRQIFDFVEERQNPATDVLLYNFPEAAVTYYADTVRQDEKIPAVRVPFSANEPPDAVAAELSQLLAGHQRVWFVPVRAQGWDDERSVQTWLMRHAVRVDGVSAHWATVDLYLPPTAVLADMTPQSVQFENGIRLLGFRIENDGAISAENPLKITLIWQTDHPQTEPLTVFVQLIDRTGVRRGGQDNQPVEGTYPITDWRPNEIIMDSYDFTPEAGAPAGEYRVWVGWYNPQTSVRMPLVSGADHAVLSVSVQVE